MKFFAIAVFSFLLSAVCAGAAAQPVIKFGETSHNFEEISERGGVASHVFTFTNEGDEPLIITGVAVNCSCTKTSFTKKPVPPGEKGEVTVSYDPKKQAGTFNKAINVYTNSEERRSILTISGSVAALPTGNSR